MKEKIFIDLDGVLANFELGVHKLGFDLQRIMNSNDNKKKGFLWSTIRKNPQFWYELELMDDALLLWDYFKHKDIHILTGIPITFGKEDFEKVKLAKINWVKKNLQLHDEKIICCATSKKPSFMVNNYHNILIDDTTKNISNWMNAGGTGILHKNTEKTLTLYNKL